jgi:hypothetical protein
MNNMKLNFTHIALAGVTALSAQQYNSYTNVPTNFNTQEYAGQYVQVAAKYNNRRYAHIFANCAAYSQVSAKYNAGANSRLSSNNTYREGDKNQSQFSKAFNELTQAYGKLSQNSEKAQNLFVNMATTMDQEERTSPVFGWSKEYNDKLSEFQKRYERMTGPLESELEQNVVVCLNIGNAWAKKYDAIKNSKKSDKSNKK